MTATASITTDQGRVLDSRCILWLKLYRFTAIPSSQSIYSQQPISVEDYKFVSGEKSMGLKSFCQSLTTANIYRIGTRYDPKLRPLHNASKENDNFVGM